MGKRCLQRTLQGSGIIRRFTGGARRVREGVSAQGITVSGRGLLLGDLREGSQEGTLTRSIMEIGVGAFIRRFMGGPWLCGRLAYKGITVLGRGLLDLPERLGAPMGS